MENSSEISSLKPLIIRESSSNDKQAQELALIEEWQKSGLSVRKFCALNHLPKSRLYNLIKKSQIKDKASTTTKFATVNFPNSNESSSTKPMNRELLAQKIPHSYFLEIESHEMRLKFSKSCDLKFILSIIKVLKSC